MANQKDFVEDMLRPNIKDDTLYHGSMTKISFIKATKLKELDKPSISLTPYKRLACLYTVPLRSIGIDADGNEKFQNARIEIKEWNGVDTPQADKYTVCPTIHVIHNIPFLKEIDQTYTGYIYYIHASEALTNSSENPVEGKGPNEVLCYIKELKPYKVEQVRIRMVTKYDKSFARDNGGDASPLDIAKEDLSLESIGKEVAANIKDSKVYHASPVKVSKLSGKKTGSWSGEQGNVFVTPCKGIAACFLINKDEIIDALREQQNIELRGQKLNLEYDVWNKPTSTLYSIPSTIKVLLNVRGIKSFKGKACGYLYTIDYSKYSDKTHMFNKNKDSDVEFLIEGDVTPESCEAVTVNYEVVSDEDSIKRHGDATPSTKGKENMEDTALEGGFFEDLGKAFKGRHPVKGLFDIDAFQRKSVLFVEFLQEQTGYFAISSTADEMIEHIFKYAQRKLIDSSDKKPSKKDIDLFFDNQCSGSETYPKFSETLPDASRGNVTLATEGIKQRIPLLRSRLTELEKQSEAYLGLGTKLAKSFESAVSKIPKKVPSEYVSGMTKLFKQGLKELKAQIESTKKIAEFFIAEYKKDIAACIADKKNIATESFNFDTFDQEHLEEFTYESLMNEGIQLLDEFHNGCKEFDDWVTKLELMQLHNTTSDAGLKQLSYSLAQENILTETVKDIFKQIGRFISWFWSKLKQLWNFFFGKAQRTIRLFAANSAKIKAHQASGKFVNIEAFKKAQAPTNLLPGVTLLSVLESWDPDPFYPAFEQCYDKFRTNILDLHEWFAHITDPNSPARVFLRAGYGSGANKATGNKGTDLISDYLACGHHCKGSFEQESYVDIDVVLGLSEMIEHIIESYKKNAKLIDSKGVSGYEASRIITNLEDRADLTQNEAADLAVKVQKLAGCMSVATDRYQKCFAKILEQGITLQTAYMKFMQ